MEGNESVVNSFQRKEHVDNFMQNNSTNICGKDKKGDVQGTE